MSESSPSNREESASPEQEDEAEGLPDGYWTGEIIKERKSRRGKGKEYLVKWEDIDPKTKKPYTPSWVASPLLLLT
jgi:hypothetical protein